MDNQEIAAEALKTGIAALIALVLGWVLGTFRKASREDVRGVEKEMKELEKRLETRITAVETGQHQQALLLAEVKTIVTQIQRDVRDIRNERAHDTN